MCASQSTATLKTSTGATTRFMIELLNLFASLCTADFNKSTGATACFMVLQVLCLYVSKKSTSFLIHRLYCLTSPTRSSAVGNPECCLGQTYVVTVIEIVMWHRHGYLLLYWPVPSIALCCQKRKGTSLISVLLAVAWHLALAASDDEQTLLMFTTSPSLVYTLWFVRHWFGQPIASAGHCQALKKYCMISQSEAPSASELHWYTLKLRSNCS